MAGVGTTYFQGNEITGFTVTGTVTVNTNSSTFRPAWSRCSLQVAPAAAADPPVNRFGPTDTFEPAPSLFDHAQISWSALGGSADLNAALMRVLDVSGIARIVVRGAGSGAVKISKRDAAGTFTDLVTSAPNSMPIVGLEPFPVDLKVVYTGDVTSGARTDISFAAGPPGVISTSSGNFETDGFVHGSEIVVNGSVSNDGTYDVDTATTGTMTLEVNNSLTAEAAGATITITTTGQVNLRFADNLVATFSGDVTTDGVTTLANVDYANCNISNGIFWSEELVSDTNTVNAGVWSLPPEAAGVNQTWSGVVGDIDGVPINDTLFISSGTNDQLSGWTVPSTPPAGAWAVQSVRQEVRAAILVGVGPQHFDFYARVGGVDELAGTDTAPLSTFGNFSYIWPENPADASPWAVSDITTGLNLGVKSLS